jgi:deoxyribonuclease V
MNLFKSTYDLVRQIPDGKVSTYGNIAKALGDIYAARAVGRMMNQNPNADDMPCFKIVYSDGRLGGFGLGIHDKINRLNHDNISVENGRIVDFENKLFDDFETDYPLKKLRSEQIGLSKNVITKDCFDGIKTIAGFDVAYPKNDFDKCCGACVVMDYKTKEIIEKKTIFEKTLFPYIATYLSYRELPFVKKLEENLNTKPSILMLDGNGILHPFGLGIASHVGVTLDIPSIGVAKSMLCGKIKNNTIQLNDKKIGYVLYSSKRAKNPVFVSPGHKISFKSSLDIVKNFCKYRLPDPIRHAHILAKSSLLLNL